MIPGRLAERLSLSLDLYQSLTSPAKYIVVRVTFFVLGTLAVLKYCSISHRKFSTSLTFLAPWKGLGSRTFTFKGTSTLLDYPPIAFFKRLISTSRSLSLTWVEESSVICHCRDSTASTTLSSHSANGKTSS